MKVINFSSLIVYFAAQAVLIIGRASALLQCGYFLHASSHTYIRAGGDGATAMASLLHTSVIDVTYSLFSPARARSLYMSVCIYICLFGSGVYSSPKARQRKSRARAARSAKGLISIYSF